MNVAAASPALDRRTRARVLRAAGIDIDTAIVESGCFFFGANVSLGDYALISHGCYFDSKDQIRVGARSAVAMGTTLITSDHELGGELQRMGRFRTAPIVIGEGVWIGARTLVLPGVTIGDGCVVAAGAVVTADLDPHALYAGVPARLVRRL